MNNQDQPHADRVHPIINLLPGKTIASVTWAFHVWQDYTLAAHKDNTADLWTRISLQFTDGSEMHFQVKFIDYEDAVLSLSYDNPLGKKEMET